MRDLVFLIFSVYYFISFVTEVGSDLYTQLTHKQNQFIYNIYLFVTLIFYYLVFSISLSGSFLKKFLTIISGVILIYAFINVIFGQGFFHYNTYTLYLETYFVMLLCIVYFYSVLRSESIIFPLKEYFFWVAAGIFISNMCSITYFLFFDYILKAHLDANGRIYQYINITSKIIEYSLAIFAFSYAPEWKKNKSLY